VASVDLPDVDVRDADPREALAFLTRLEAAAGIPPVDEDEQRRLAGHPPVRDAGWGWTAHLVELDGVTVAYAGIRMLRPAASGSAASGSAASGSAASRSAARVDLAIDRAQPEASRALAAALVHLRSHAGPPETAVEAWLRGATPEDLATAADAGFRVRSRLHVLGASADELARRVPLRGGDATLAAGAALPAGLRLRTFAADAPESEAADADAVVRLLQRAYPDMADWYADGFAVLRASDWFRAEDLLLLEGPEETGVSGGDGVAGGGGGLRALHWMKRRGDGVGEVYNLAVDPAAQGQGFGPLLLDEGLARLVAAGIREVILWVDADNPTALALYRSRGFTLRWDDVSLAG